MNRIEQLFKEWQQLQPLKPEDQKRLDDKFRLDFNYNSNHIEGNTLTYGQTRLLLFFGEAAGDAKMRDYEEMKAHNVGLRWIEELAKDHTHRLTEKDIRDLNRIILVEDYYKVQNGNRIQIKVGEYKSRPNLVITATGEELHYASPEETPAMMSDFVSWLNKEIADEAVTPVELASLVHYRYIRIHPFDDGNGRIARLLVTYVLERFGYPMIIIRSDDKENYLRALNKSDINVGLTPSDGANARLEAIKPFVEYMTAHLQRSLEISIKAAKGESIEEDDDFAKRITLLEREAKSKKRPPIFSETEVWNVLEYFYFPLEKRVREALKPAELFFSKVIHWNTLSKNAERSLGGLNLKSVEKKFFDALRTLEHSDELQLNSVEKTAYENYVKIKDFGSNARAVFFYFKLEHPKRKYNIDDLKIKIDFNIRFENDYYTVSCLDNKQFRYGTYPSEEEIKGIVSKYKAEVEVEIKNAVENSK
ncbi:MAG: Fic family protein [Rikenellaceae bacterium]|nr:Fic family protein [Rikenellaceae bacterium]MCL2692434.1 Fic family protein [Rikenellaceae bacterium]